MNLIFRRKCKHKKIVFGGFWMIAGILMTVVMENAPLIPGSGFFAELFVLLLVIAGYAMLGFGIFMTIKGLKDKDN